MTRRTKSKIDRLRELAEQKRLGKEASAEAQDLIRELDADEDGPTREELAEAFGVSRGRIDQLVAPNAVDNRGRRAS